MARQQNRLSAIEVQRKSTPGRYADGVGLYLQIGPTGAKSWLFRYKIGGKSRVMGLGPVHAISLKEARERAAEWRKRLTDGLDPIEEREAAAAAAQAACGQTFKTYAEEYISQNEHAWRNPQTPPAVAKYAGNVCSPQNRPHADRGHQCHVRGSARVRKRLIPTCIANHS